MKKLILAMLAFLAFSGFTYADNKLVVGDVEVPQGGSAIVTVTLVNETPFGGFQFDMKLPAGISATSITPSKRISDMGVTYPLTVTLKDEANNIYNVLGYNTEMKNIVGSEGDIAYITLSAAASVEKGEYNANVTGITMSTVDAKQTTNPDATFKITVGDTWILDENSTIAPVTTESAVKVKVIRKIPANTWSTICLPFEMTKEQTYKVFGEDVQLAYFEDGSVEVSPSVGSDAVDKITLTFTEDDLSEGFTANWAYLIKCSNEIKEFEVDGVVIEPGEVESEYSVKVGKKTYKYGFYGTYVAETLLPENTLFLSGNQFWYSTGKTKMKAFRCYFNFADVLADKGNTAKINFVVDGESTSIDGMGFQRNVEGVYDLSGRKIMLEDGDVTKLQKGVYIIDGKKVTIK